ncbi:MAG: hypothetical protein NWE85_05000 [Candidatus Bathyarchaeota archaeon]|nr:hypothetical protein [Candidatus Bathyarchaeota archaeon]
MYKKCFKKQLREFLQSKKALAIPVTYLILFASLIAIISVTYSFAIVKISARGALLKASVAKQNMQILDDAVRSVAWSFGASKVVYMDDCGGIFRTEPTAKNLVLNFTDEQTFYDIVFNSSVGKAFYELEPSEFNYEGFCIRGARADFTLTVQSIAANLAIDYAVNITTTIEINSSYTTLEGEEKLVNITCRVFNEDKSAR